ncbi:NAD(P)/FAD-dependent oxidoreductase [Lactobacillus sp. DCY120]|uniref:Ferredoxin--NADP reductase n=1 Tax=Bombilactobacillus apium TaxID=2675299 RepID=A0A850R5F2_9LACO|nr:NAD(P)/FAD-dependent oxidoreductase [Bombilactobacillus apium]NVY97191.1 NAD(P)/FAD-dependent oxidoreductase [Bombilactobacillus apium]
MSDKIYDLVVVGGGPVGIFTAFYARMRSLDTVLLESMPRLGGQPQNLYAQKHLYDVAGQFNVQGSELIDHLLVGSERFNYPKLVNTTMLNFTWDSQNQFYQIKTNQEALRARALIITIGNGPFQPRKLAFDYAPEIEGHQLNYFVEDLEDYKDQTVLIAGGGDTAIDWALEINQISQKTYLLHRRNQFRALESSVEQLQQSTVELLTPEIIEGLHPLASNQLQVNYKTVKTGTQHQLIVNKLLVNYGITSDSRLLRSWGLNLQGPFIKVDSQMRTNLPQIYAAGDAVTYPGKQRLIALGFSEGPIAVNSLIQDLYPEQKAFGHSSSMFN